MTPVIFESNDELHELSFEALEAQLYQERAQEYLATDTRLDEQGLREMARTMLRHPAARPILNRTSQALTTALCELGFEHTEDRRKPVTDATNDCLLAHIAFLYDEATNTHLAAITTLVASTDFDHLGRIEVCMGVTYVEDTPRFDKNGRRLLEPIGALRREWPVYYGGRSRKGLFKFLASSFERELAYGVETHAPAYAKEVAKAVAEATVL